MTSAEPLRTCTRLYHDVPEHSFQRLPPRSGFYKHCASCREVSNNLVSLFQIDCSQEIRQIRLQNRALHELNPNVSIPQCQYLSTTSPLPAPQTTVQHNPGFTVFRDALDPPAARPVSPAAAVQPPVGTNQHAS